MMRLTCTLLPLLTLLLVTFFATSMEHVGSSRKRNPSDAPPVGAKVYSNINLSGQSIIEILNEAIQTRGCSLADNPEKQKLILANRKSLTPLLLSMTDSFKTERINRQSWNRVEKVTSNLQKLTRGKPAGITSGRIWDGWSRRRNNWIILKDTENGQYVPLLPSIDHLEDICRDPVNRHTILSRFAGTISFTMILIATHAFDARAAMGIDKDTGIYRMMDPNVVDLTDYTFQLNCMSSALAQAKSDAEIRDTPPGSVIDWAEKVLEATLTHMVGPNDEGQGDGDGAYKMVRDVSSAIGWLVDSQSFFFNRLNELYGKARESKSYLDWPERRHRHIQNIAALLGSVFERLFQPHVDGKPRSDTPSNIYRIFTHKDPDIFHRIVKRPSEFGL